MRKIKCPLCGGRDRLRTPPWRRPKLEVECPACEGRGWLWELEPDDLVDVEYFAKFGYAYIHTRLGDWMREEDYVEPDVPLRRALEEIRARELKAYFCEHCFGKFVVYGGEVIACA